MQICNDFTSFETCLGYIYDTNNKLNSAWDIKYVLSNSKLSAFLILFLISLLGCTPLAILKKCNLIKSILRSILKYFKLEYLI